MNLQEVEAHFRNEHENWGFIADEKSFDMIFALIEQIKERNESIDRHTALTRHYCNHFFGGSVDKMMETFGYLKGDQEWRR